MAVRTPHEYVESLKDGRRIYLDGKLYHDVTEHPILKRGVQRGLIDYAMCQDPRYRDMIVIHDQNGEPYNMCFKPPESAQDLIRSCRENLP